jgi:hypothetical protein
MFHRAGLMLAPLVFVATAHVAATPPKVVITSPDNGEIEVDPAMRQIQVDFDQPMNPESFSVVGGGPSFPTIGGKPKWLTPKTLAIPVALQPGREYTLSLNSDTFKGFRNRAGDPLEWYPVRFRTRASGAKPAKPDVTPEQNKAAMAELRKAIDENYAYRDLLKIDWTKEIDQRQAKFESATSANEFARLAAHLLRLAEDAHVSVEAGDVRIGTRANSAPPNSNFQSLAKLVPSVKEHGNDVFSGKLGDGVGYILLADCSKRSADAFDNALDELKDTTALILDLRMNGGGDELAARQVAGRFVEQAAIYSKNRIREEGKWTGPLARAVEPRPDATRYDKPVAVLMGAKIVSSAESLVLMMKHGAEAKLIGDTTGGSSGRPVPHDLGNGVTVYLSSWEDQLPDGTVLEGCGVKPDIIVKTKADQLENADPVLEAARKYLRGKLATAHGS